MPGYANFKTLYKEEYDCLRDEGYDVERFIQPSPDAEGFLPFPNECDSYNEGDDKELWKKAYYNLIKVRELPLVENYPYFEPNDFEEIISILAVLTHVAEKLLVHRIISAKSR